MPSTNEEMKTASMSDSEEKEASQNDVGSATADERRFVLVGELHAKGSAGEKKQQKEQKLTEKTFSKVRVQL
jgi:hypothetical protein